jgi:hypothetical protein
MNHGRWSAASTFFNSLLGRKTDPYNDRPKEGMLAQQNKPIGPIDGEQN